MLTPEKYVNSSVEIEYELLYLFNKTDSLTVFDIGACEAEDSIRYSNLFPHSTIYAFEPRQDNILKAQQLISQYEKSNILLENIALADSNDILPFYLSSGEPGNLKNNANWDHGNKSSSLLPPSEQMEKILSYLQIGKEEGAECLIGGERNDLGGDYAEGYYIKPTVFKGHNKMRIFQEEICVGIQLIS